MSLTFDLFFRQMVISIEKVPILLKFSGPYNRRVPILCSRLVYIDTKQHVTEIEIRTCPANFICTK